MRELWPPSEPAQVDYEALRAAALAGTALIGPAGARFGGGGLGALVLRPVVSDPVFVATLRGALRPAWTPHHDPRLDALATGLALVVSVAEGTDALGGVAR